MIPDAEKITGKYLREHADLVALDARVVGKTPDAIGTPWIKLVQLDADDLSGGVDHLVSFLLQFDCYAGATGGQPETILLARTVRGALRGMPGSYDGGVVTSVTFAGMARIPDSDIEPARERVILTATVAIHP